MTSNLGMPIYWKVPYFSFQETFIRRDTRHKQSLPNAFMNFMNDLFATVTMYNNRI